MSDNTLNADGIIPFAVLNAGENNPDLMFMICKQLELLFVDQKKTTNYEGMMDSLTEIADDIRNNYSNSDRKTYSKNKQLQYSYLEILTQHIPDLLKNEDFFKSVFK